MNILGNVAKSAVIGGAIFYGLQSTFDQDAALVASTKGAIIGAALYAIKAVGGKYAFIGAFAGLSLSALSGIYYTAQFANYQKYKWTHYTNYVGPIAAGAVAGFVFSIV